VNLLDLESILRSHFEGKIIECSFNESQSTELTTRDRLLMVFQRRLNGLENLSVLTEPQKDILPEMKSFVQKLSSLPSDEDLYTWKANISGTSWKGWVTKKQIIYALRKNT